MRFSSPYSAAATLLFAGVSAHTWVEQMSVIGDNGTFVGAPGYSRGYVPRGPDFADAKMSYLLPPNDGSGRIRISQADFLCRPEQRNANSNPPDWPQLRALPGSMVAAKYLENGHVTLPATQMGKPGSGGLIYIYATTKPNPDMKIPDIFKWTATGDLATGRLLAVNNYDDGRCYQVNGASEMSVARQKEFPNPPAGQPITATHESWCETDFQIPKDAQAGSMAVYWVWQWPTLASMNPNGPLGKDEMYTTCSDVQIVNDASTINQAVSGKVLEGQDPRKEAVKNFQERIANVTLPANPAFYGPNSNFSANTSSGAPAPPSSATSPPPVPSAPGAPGAPSVPGAPPMSFTTLTRTMSVTVTRTLGAAGLTGAAAPTGTTQGQGKRSVRPRGY
ncbi:hypothetical protein FKW77_006621 [Venturia effusa]|uniref:DUF7492 domain-containing protein n=1 Tax=Venturia effusa TaxID=50376 RepID=A0A517L3J3_9PEZI|nr:hypothetical protein FKW77_006621 [Venturia effusa]